MPNPEKIHKYEAARHFCMCVRSFRHYCNVVIFDELKLKTGYRRNQKYLYKRQLDYLFPKGLKLG